MFVGALQVANGRISRKNFFTFTRVLSKYLAFSDGSINFEFHFVIFVKYFHINNFAINKDICYAQVTSKNIHSSRVGTRSSHFSSQHFILGLKLSKHSRNFNTFVQTFREYITRVFELFEIYIYFRGILLRALDDKLPRTSVIFNAWDSLLIFLGFLKQPFVVSVLLGLLRLVCCAYVTMDRVLSNVKRKETTNIVNFFRNIQISFLQGNWSVSFLK